MPEHLSSTRLRPNRLWRSARSRGAAASCAVLVAAGLAAVSTGPATAAPPSDEYVAMGDSYASGNGTGNRDLDYSCYRSSDAYGPIIAEEREQTALTFTACGGDTTDDVLANQVGALSADTDYVTLSIGGNDVGFVDLILNCWGYYDQASCLATADEVNDRIDNELPAKLDKTHAAIQASAPDATVMQVGYPRAFGDDVSCSQADGIDPTEAAALNGVADNLERVISERAAANGVTYLSVIEAFTGHDVCADDPYLVGKWAWDAADVYHPSKAGHRDGFMPLVRAVMG